jgi:hypothetical protein
MDVTLILIPHTAAVRETVLLKLARPFCKSYIDVFKM